MKFSVGLLSYISTGHDVRAHAQLAHLAEALGYGAYWVADNRWHRDVWTTLAACAVSTERIALGPRLTDPYIRHPALTAVAMASLDELSGGRAILGLGAGGSGFSQLGIERSNPVLALREAVDLTRRLWSGEAVQYDGRTVAFRGGALAFPARQGIPVLVGGRGPRILELAGEIADIAMVGGVASPRGVRWARGHVQRGMRRSARRDADVELCAMTYVALADDPRAAKNGARRAVAQAVAGSYPVWDFIAAAGLEVPEDLRALVTSGIRAPDKIAPLVPEAFIERLSVAGDPASCASQISAMGAEGVAHVVVAPIPVDGPAEQLVERFAREVIPRVA